MKAVSRSSEGGSPDSKGMCSTTDVLRRLGGIARTRSLRQAGLTARHLSDAVRRELVVSPRRGLYALRDTPPDVLHAAEHGGVLGCTSAAAAAGLWTMPHDDIHVWMGSSGQCRSVSCDHCILHWTPGIPRVDKPLPLTSALLQLARCLGEEAFFASLESALRIRALSRSDVAGLRRALPDRLRWLVDFARSDADSGLESVVRLRLHRIGITVRTQVLIPATGRVDFLIGEKLIVEIDGRANHDGQSMRHKDLVRDTNAAIWGYETLRFDYAMIMRDWVSVEAAILAKIAAHTFVSKTP